MIPKRIEHATHNLGAPVNWDPATDGRCGVLAVRVHGEPRQGRGYCESAWEPTPAEIELLRHGGNVILRIIGWQPAVALYVETAVEGVPRISEVEPAEIDAIKALLARYGLRVEKIGNTRANLGVTPEFALARLIRDCQRIGDDPGKMDRLKIMRAVMRDLLAILPEADKAHFHWDSLSTPDAVITGLLMSEEP